MSKALRRCPAAVVHPFSREPFVFSRLLRWKTTILGEVKHAPQPVTLSAYPRQWILNQPTTPSSDLAATTPADAALLPGSEEESLRLPVVVMKMGGSSLGNADAINRSAHIIHETYSRGVNVVVVVSALYGVTNKLEQACRAKTMEEAAALREELRNYHLEQAETLLSDDAQAMERVRQRIDDILTEFFDPRVKAMVDAGGAIPEHYNIVLGLGERMVVPLFTAVVASLGVPASEVYTEELILKQSIEPQSKILMGESRELVRKAVIPLLKQGKTPIVSGYIAGTRNKQITTLGRGGSDLTATFVAYAVDANEVNLWKVESVDFPNGFMKAWQSMSAQHRWTGIRSADPKQVDGAQIVPSLSYNEATELAHFGKKVLHPQTMMPLVVHQIPLFVRNTSRPSHAGTMIGHVQSMQLWGQGESDHEEVQSSAIVTVPFSKYLGLHEKSELIRSTVAALQSAVQTQLGMSDPVLVALVGPSLASSAATADRVCGALGGGIASTHGSSSTTLGTAYTTTATAGASPVTDNAVLASYSPSAAAAAAATASAPGSIAPLRSSNYFVPSPEIQIILGSVHSFCVVIDAKDEKAVMQQLHSMFVVPTLSRTSSAAAAATAASASAITAAANAASTATASSVSAVNSTPSETATATATNAAGAPASVSRHDHKPATNAVSQKHRQQQQIALASLKSGAQSHSIVSLDPTASKKTELRAVSLY